MRDYGTGAWEGGDEGCDHTPAPGKSGGQRADRTFTLGEIYRDVCRKCGATRTDQQLGLEPTPEEYVTRMVEVFREVRRVLASHGTVWLNLGDSYARAGGWSDNSGLDGLARGESGRAKTNMGTPGGVSQKLAGGLKEKDLVGIPWRVAFALQADGWYLRSDIIWAKPNPMPESVTDRPTKAHEYVFLLSKQPRYFFDQEAVREAAPFNTNRHFRSGTYTDGNQDNSSESKRGAAYFGEPPNGRNIRSVWEIATQPYPEAHFATFPEELARRCIAAGCPEQVCRVCGKVRERIVEVSHYSSTYGDSRRPDAPGSNDQKGNREGGAMTFASGERKRKEVETLGYTDCGHSDYRPGLTLDPFIGSGTVAHVARKLGRHAVGIDLNESYLQLAARRLQQQSLFAESV